MGVFKKAFWKLNVFSVDKYLKDFFKYSKDIKKDFFPVGDKVLGTSVGKKKGVKKEKYVCRERIYMCMHFFFFFSHFKVNFRFQDNVTLKYFITHLLRIHFPK